MPTGIQRFNHALTVIRGRLALFAGLALTLYVPPAAVAYYLERHFDTELQGLSFVFALAWAITTTLVVETVHMGAAAQIPSIPFFLWEGIGATALNIMFLELYRDAGGSIGTSDSARGSAGPADGTCPAGRRAVL
jgi:hypothetical protein